MPTIASADPTLACKDLFRGTDLDFRGELTLVDDFGIMLSPRMFEQFALPDLYRVTEYMAYSLYHLDGTPQMRFLDLLLENAPGAENGAGAIYVEAVK